MAAESSCGKPVYGEGIVRNHHESNRKWKSLSDSFRCRYVGKRPCRYPQDTAESFVKWSSAGLLHSPALENGGDDNGGSEPFGAGGDTHTVPLRGAHVKNLNSHLKCLRNKRKERQKEQR